MVETVKTAVYYGFSWIGLWADQREGAIPSGEGLVVSESDGGVPVPQLQSVEDREAGVHGSFG